MTFPTNSYTLTLVKEKRYFVEITIKDSETLEPIRTITTGSDWPESFFRSSSISSFPVEVVVDIAMTPMNSRVVVDNFVDVKIPANSKKQLELNLHVIAPGETTILAQITDSTEMSLVPQSVLQIHSTVIDKRVTWFTTGAAILLLLAAITQSVRRVRRGRNNEI